tara:strand:- start:202 stop:942 length:741 start_codon:yes stop_codon:yes gene_type:complete
MKILVCVSKVPDTTSKINFVDNNSKFDQNGVQYIVNPYDEWYALVRALELVESNGGTVTTITVGNSSDDPTIRKALAIGANDAVRINANPTDSYFVAKQIADYAANEDYDIIMTGKETIDYNGSQIGSMLSALLEMPFVSLASKLETEGSKAVLERDVQGGLEVVEVDFPFVLSASKGMAEQRIPNMRGIMAARTKPLKVIEPVEQKALTSVVKFELPNPKTGCKYVDPENMEELVELLHNESKVI